MLERILVSHGRPKARKDYDKGARVKLWKYFSILSSCAKCFERYGSFAINVLEIKTWDKLDLILKQCYKFSLLEMHCSSKSTENRVVN